MAVPLPSGVRAALHAVVRELEPRAPRVAWTRVEQLHVTLRFLGSLDEPTLDRVRQAVAAAAGETAPFTLMLGGLGAFPTAQQARVLWAGLTRGAEALRALHGRLERALAARGLPPEARAFHPHVTLGRARDPRGVRGLDAELGAPRGPFDEVRVDAVHLMRSDLGPGGAQHRVLAESRLGGVRVDLPGSAP